MNLKKKVAAAAVALTIIGGAGAAYAYWTTTGAGTGSASTASSNGTVTLHATFSSGALYPGGSVPVMFTADNSADTDLRVQTIHLDSVTTNPSSCVATDFTMADVTSNTTVTHKTTGQAITGTGTLAFANDPVNSQDTCKGATITLNLTSN